jgi:hypothetical protein
MSQSAAHTAKVDYLIVEVTPVVVRAASAPSAAAVAGATRDDPSDGGPTPA